MKTSRNLIGLNNTIHILRERIKRRGKADAKQLESYFKKLITII